MPRVGPYLWVGLHLWRLSSLWVPTWAASYSLSRRLRQAYIAFSVCAVATQGKKWMVSDLAIWLFHPLRSLHPLWTLWGQPLPHGLAVHPLRDSLLQMGILGHTAHNQLLHSLSSRWRLCFLAWSLSR